MYLEKFLNGEINFLFNKREELVVFLEHLEKTTSVKWNGDSMPTNYVPTYSPCVLYCRCYVERGLRLTHSSHPRGGEIPFELCYIGYSGDKIFVI